MRFGFVLPLDFVGVGVESGFGFLEGTVVGNGVIPRLFIYIAVVIFAQGVYLPLLSYVFGAAIEPVHDGQSHCLQLKPFFSPAAEAVVNDGLVQ